jgi:hypothetical protein
MLPYNQPMNKLVLGLGAFVGSSIGGYIPLLWDGSMFSFVSLPFSLIGAFYWAIAPPSILDLINLELGP